MRDLRRVLCCQTSAGDPPRGVLRGGPDCCGRGGRVRSSCMRTFDSSTVDAGCNNRAQCAEPRALAFRPQGCACAHFRQGDAGRGVAGVFFASDGGVGRQGMGKRPSDANRRRAGAAAARGQPAAGDATCCCQPGGYYHRKPCSIFLRAPGAGRLAARRAWLGRAAPCHHDPSPPSSMMHAPDTLLLTFFCCRQAAALYLARQGGYDYDERRPARRRGRRRRRSSSIRPFLAAAPATGAGRSNIDTTRTRRATDAIHRIRE